MSATVSVVLPAFDRLPYLRAAIDSVVAQTFEDWELLIADDGSGEETRRYLRELRDPRIRVLLGAHTGNPGAARNAGIREASGKYIAFIDSDDLWLPEKLQVQVAAMRAQPERRWSYTDLCNVDENGAPIKSRRRAPLPPFSGSVIDEALTLRCPAAVPCAMVVRELLQELGGFDTSCRYYEDCDLWYRLAVRSEVIAIPQVLTHVRRQARSYFTSNPVAQLRDRGRLLAKMRKAAPRSTPVRKAVTKEYSANVLRLARALAAAILR